MKTCTPQLENAISEIRASDAVVVVGAGASFMAGMPLAGQLSPIVWQVLDQHSDVFRSTCLTLGVAAGSGKSAIGDDWANVKVAFSYIAGQNDARRDFQKAFAILNAERTKAISPTHSALARLVHCRIVNQVVSLNWDTLLEAAFENRYGIPINAQGRVLWKPHGDCASPQDDWTLPHDAGHVPNDLLTVVTALARERPRALVIVGYSERDDVVVQRLISPLASQWRVFRISPSAAGEGAIAVSAPDAVGKIAEVLCPEPSLPGWAVVTFSNQRGIEGAISGEHLGPQDVDVCPQLPHFDGAKRQLDLLHAVEVQGAPGCGKSITGWQLAREYHKAGWEVLRPEAVGLDIEAALQAIHRRAWKRIVVVDNAQVYPLTFLNSLRSAAAPDLKVICCSTDASQETAKPVRIPVEASVKAIAAEFRRRRDEILPIVRHYDSDIGDGYHEISLERRIDDAARATTPWELAFILRGEWRYMRRQLNGFRDHDRADLALAIVAACQVVSLDVGTNEATVAQYAGHFGRNQAWVRDALAILLSHRAILPGGMLRCPHIMAAVRIIKETLSDPVDASFWQFVAVLRQLVRDSIRNPRGLSWLLEDSQVMMLGFYQDPSQPSTLYTELLDSIVAHCLKQTGSIERRDAAFLLSRLIAHRVLLPERLRPHFAILARWVEAADGQNSGAIAWALNNLYNGSKTDAAELVELVDPATMDAHVAGARTADAYAWGYLLGRLWLAATQEWRDRLKALLPREKIESFIDRFQPEEVGGLSELLQSIGAIDLDFGEACLDRAVGVLKLSFARDPIDALTETRDLQWQYLGLNPFSDRRPTRRERNVSKKILDGLKPETVCKGICSCRFGEWRDYAELLMWVRRDHPANHKSIVAAMDWNWLSARMEALWNKPPLEMQQLLFSFAYGVRGGPVRALIERHASEMDEMDPSLALISPEAAVGLLHAGKKLHLFAAYRHDWDVQANALAGMASIDASLVAATLDAGVEAIAARLTQLAGIDCKGFAQFLRAADGLRPKFLVDVFQRVDPVVATEKWRVTMSEAQSPIRRGAKAICVLAREHGPPALKAVSRKLLDSPPKRRAGRK
jgi:hypothetical protein